MSFVRDYVEFRIDYSILRALTPPTGTIDGTRWSFPTDPAPSLLRSYIGRPIRGIALTPDRILISFTDEAEIEISLRPDDRQGPEAAHFVPASADGTPDASRMWIW